MIKKYLFLIFAITLFNNAFSQDWTYVGYSSDGTKYFIRSGPASVAYTNKKKYG